MKNESPIFKHLCNSTPAIRLEHIFIYFFLFSIFSSILVVYMLYGAFLSIYLCNFDNSLNIRKDFHKCVANANIIKVIWMNEILIRMFISILNHNLSETRKWNSIWKIVTVKWYYYYHTWLFNNQLQFKVCT